MSWGATSGSLHQLQCTGSWVPSIAFSTPPLKMMQEQVPPHGACFCFACFRCRRNPSVYACGFHYASVYATSPRHPWFSLLRYEGGIAECRTLWIVPLAPPPATQQRLRLDVLLLFSITASSSRTGAPLGHSSWGWTPVERKALRAVLHR